MAVRHRGSFFTIDRAFHDLRIWLLAHGMNLDACEMYGVYLSDPSHTDESELESLACVSVPESFARDLLPLSPDAPSPQWYSLRAGSYAVLTHQPPHLDLRGCLRTRKNDGGCDEETERSDESSPVRH